MKKLMAFIMSAVILSSTAAFAAVKDADNHWAKETIISAEKDGWLDVRENGNFEPNALATREEVVYMIYSAILNQENNIDNNVSGDLSKFTDSSLLNNKYKKAFEVFIGNSLIKGYPDKTVKPKGNITRAEAATIISSLLADKALKAYYTPFMDYLPDWAKVNIERCARAGIIAGYPNHTFMPSNNITRAEIVIMVNQLVEFNKDGKFNSQETTKASAKPSETTTESATETTTEAVSESTTEEITVNEEKANALLELINNKRFEEGVNPVELSDELNKVATLKAADMYNLKIMEEISPNYGSIEKMLSDGNIKFTSSTFAFAEGVEMPFDVISVFEDDEAKRTAYLAPNYEKAGIGYYNDKWCIIYIK